MVSRPRAGFGLAEVIVALVILATGVLSAAALASAAAALLRAAQLEEIAVDGAEALMDSLRIGDAQPGERRHGVVHYSWQISDTDLREVILVARVSAGSQQRVVPFGALAVVP